MKITIISESGDWKEMLYTKDKATYEVKDKGILDFFTQLNEAYNNGDDTDELFECLYNLINYGYLHTDTEFENSDDENFDEDFDDEFDDNYNYNEDEDDYDDDFDDLEFISQKGFKLINSDIEYFVDGEKVSKDDYDAAWDERLGYLGSSNWEETGLSIINANTDEIIFSGKLS